MAHVATVRYALEIEGINYSSKIKNLTWDWAGHRSRVDFGSFGVDPNYERQYVIYVRKRDMAEAEYVIRRVLHSG